MEASVRKGYKPIPPKAAAFLALFSLPFILVGTIIVRKALGVTASIGEMYAPRWVGAAGGLLFLVSGVFILALAVRSLVVSSPLSERTVGLGVGMFATIFLTLLASMCWGLALFGDPRGYSGGMTGAAIEGRILFGIFGTVLSLVALCGWLLLLLGLIGLIAGWIKKPGMTA